MLVYLWFPDSLKVECGGWTFSRQAPCGGDQLPVPVGMLIPSPLFRLALKPSILGNLMVSGSFTHPVRLTIVLCLCGPAVLRNIFLVACVLLACSALFPVLWHLWIYAGSANSNFYYAITLLFNVAQVRRAVYLRQLILAFRLLHKVDTF